jgi:hypothetical protein
VLATPVVGASAIGVGEDRVGLKYSLELFGVAVLSDGSVGVERACESSIRAVDLGI